MIVDNIFPHFRDGFFPSYSGFLAVKPGLHCRERRISAPTTTTSITATATTTTTTTAKLTTTTILTMPKLSNLKRKLSTSTIGDEDRAKRSIRRRRTEDFSLCCHNNKMTKISKLLELPAEILFQVLYDDEITDQDRLELRLVHRTFDAIVSMKPFLPVTINLVDANPQRRQRRQKKRTVCSDLSDLLSPAFHRMRPFVKSLSITMQQQHAGKPGRESEVGTLIETFPNLHNVSLRVAKSNSATAGIGGSKALLRRLSNGGVDDFSVKVDDTLPPVLGAVSNASSLDLCFNIPDERVHRMHVARAISRSPGLRRLSLSSTSAAGEECVNIDNTLDTVGDSHELHLKSLTLDNVKLPRKVANIEKLRSLEAITIPVHDGDSVPADDSHTTLPLLSDDNEGTNGEVDTWSAFAHFGVNVSSISVPALPSYYHNNIFSTYAYIRHNSPNVRHLDIHYIHPSFPLSDGAANSLSDMAASGQVFWRDVFPAIQNTLITLRIRADAGKFAAVLGRTHKFLDDVAAPIVIRLLKRALVNITPPYAIESSSLEELELNGMFFGVDYLCGELGRYGGCTSLRKLKLCLVEDRVVSNETLMGDRKRVSEALTSCGDRDDLAMMECRSTKVKSEVQLHRYSLDRKMRVERDILTNRGQLAVQREADILF